MSTAHPIFASIDWVALEWVLELNQQVERDRPTPEEHQLLLLWVSAGNFSSCSRECERLQQIILAWCKFPTFPAAMASTPGSSFSVVILVALLKGVIVSHQTGVRSSVAAMNVVRELDEHQREVLRKALSELHHGRVSKALRGRLSVPEQGQATLLVNLRDALDVLMRDIEDYVYDECTTS